MSAAEDDSPRAMPERGAWDESGTWKSTADWMSAHARKIRCIFSDVDGVMTDGEIIYDSSGNETKSFSVRDGLAIKYWLNLGRPFVIVTARTSSMVERRSKELGVTKFLQGFESKFAAVEQTLSELGLELDQCAYIGDDLPDVPVMRRVGLATTPADGSVDAKQASHGVLTTAGGRGAVRELVEVLLRLQGDWSAETWESWSQGGDTHSKSSGLGA
ncbi:MAG: HAD hydrolase family protein, partial [Planctomycetota bacterium]